VTSHRVLFAIAPGPFLVFVTFVAGDVHDGSAAAAVANCFEHVNGAHHIHLICFHRLCVRRSHEGLRCKVEDDLRAEAIERLSQRLAIADVSEHRFHAFADGGEVEQVVLLRRRECIAGNLRSQPLQPQRQPAAFESCVTGNQHALAAPELRIHCHTFHGAFFVAHNSSN